MIMIFAGSLLSGCAKTVTPVFPAGKHLVVDINFKSAIDTNQNKYFIFFNNDSAPQLPFMPIQFVEPGEISPQPNIDMYGQYYSTWKEYVVLDGNSFYFVKGPFTSEAVPSREVVATWTGSQSSRITLTLNLSEFKTLTNRLNFDFVTVDKSTKLVKDNLSTLNSSPSPYYVLTVSDSIVSGSDEATAGILDNQDILNWRVLVQ